MRAGGIEIFNQAFTFFSLLAFAVSLMCYKRFKKTVNTILRMSFIGACVFAIVASIVPAFSILLTIAFVPSFIYHSFEPLALAPFVVPPIGFAATFATLILLQELFNVVSQNAEPMQLKLPFLAVAMFSFMSYQISNGLLDFKIIYNAEQILSYAATGTDVSQLEKIYTEVAISHDGKLFNEVLVKLAFNPNAPTELLRVVYARTLDSGLDEPQRDYIFTALSKNPHASADLLSELLLTISQNSSAPPNALASAAHNPNFSQDTLLQLAVYPDCEIRRVVIGYPNISENVLTKIVNDDPDIGVRRDAKRRLDFLHGISHLDADNRLALKQNEKLVEPAAQIVDPVQLVAIYKNMDLDEDPDGVLASLAANCYITEKMARDIYAKAASRNGYARTGALMALAVNPQTPADILTALAKEKELSILRALASNPNISHEIINQFAPYPDCKIRKEIICQPRASIDTLKKLRHDSDESVAQEATERMREQQAYLEVCQELKKVNPSCEKFYGVQAAPDMRAYPNTSQNVLPQNALSRLGSE
jgi:hypothetical protein